MDIAFEHIVQVFR